MENQEKIDFDKVGIGTKETETLKPVPVLIQGHRIENVEKDGKVIGKKVVFICKHPDREETIEISQVRYLKADKVATSGLWFNLDSDNLISKQSALAETMRRYECNTIADFDSKNIPTDLNGKYLVIKAY